MDDNAERNLNYRDLAQEIQSGRILVIALETILVIIVKNVTHFCPCLSNLSEAKLKSFGSMTLAVEFRRLTSTDCVVWLLMITAM